MNIAGVLVHALPGERETVRTALAEFDGVEVHHETEDGRFIVTIADADDARGGDTILVLQQVRGIAAASLVYHHFEPEDFHQHTSPARHARARIEESRP